MRGVAALVVFFLVVFVGGSLLGSWVWHGLRHLAEGWPAAWTASLARHPFHRVLNRCMLFLALVGMIPLARALGMRQWRQLGLAWTGRPLRRALQGVGVGMAMFAVALIMELGLGSRLWRADLGWQEGCRALLKGAMSGLAVGCLEEVLFRGVLLGGLIPALGRGTALVVSSAIFSGVHFIPRPSPPAGVSWWSGLEALGEMMWGLASADRLVPAALTLLAAGVLLGKAYVHTGTLYFPIGLHGAWVFGMKIRGLVTVGAEPAQAGWLQYLSGGWLQWLLVSAAAVIAFLVFRPCREQSLVRSCEVPERKEVSGKSVNGP